MSAGDLHVGAWRLRGARELFESARPFLEEAARARTSSRTSSRGPRELCGHSTYFKGSRLRPGAALRHATRRALGPGEIPRLQEFANLEWLREHDFQAVRPLLAGVHAPRALPRYQFLFTELVPHALDLASAFPAASPERRARLLLALARDVARMHSLDFVHHDLFPRNLLSVPGEEGCIFLDTWRSPPGRPARPPEHDLGCLFLDGASLFESSEQRLFLRTYREERLRHGTALPPLWPARVEQARLQVHAREARRRPDVATTWRFPGI